MLQAQESIKIPSQIMELYREMEISPETLLRDYVFNSISGKINKYEAENKLFEDKYKTTFSAFHEINNKQKRLENFEWEDDLMDWEFAYKSLVYWKGKLKNIK